MGRKGTTVVLILLTAPGCELLLHMNLITRIVTLLIAIPPLLFSLYIIWIDSKKPWPQQFRFSNSRWGKK